MIARAIENWLTKTKERSFQLPYCQVLLSQGHSVIYISTHGLMEQGKDMITIGPDSEPCAYQLKTGDIGTNEWRAIRGEIEELIQLPIVHSSVDKNKIHRAYLVTNGEITDPVRIQISEMNEDNVRKDRKYAYLEIINGQKLLAEFIDAQGVFLPKEIADFDLFLKTYLSDGTDFLHKEQFFSLVDRCFFSEFPKNKKERLDAISSSIILIAYALLPYQQANNHFALFQAWTSLSACIIRYASRAELSNAETKASLSIVRAEIERHLENLAEEALSKKDFLEGSLLGDGGAMYAARTTMILGSICLHELLRRLKDASYAPDLRITSKLQENIKYLWFWGDSAFPYFFSVIRYLEVCEHGPMAEQILEDLLKQVVRSVSRDGEGLPGPYNEVSQILEHGMGSDDYDFESADFTGESFSLESLVFMAARRGKRQLIGSQWKSISHIMFSEFQPQNEIDWFTWRTENGDNHWRPPGEQQSWKVLVDNAADISACPQVIKENPDICFAFLFVAPQRGTSAVYRYLDSLWG